MGNMKSTRLQTVKFYSNSGSAKTTTSSLTRALTTTLAHSWPRWAASGQVWTESDSDSTHYLVIISWCQASSARCTTSRPSTRKNGNSIRNQRRKRRRKKKKVQLIPNKIKRNFTTKKRRRKWQKLPTLLKKKPKSPVKRSLQTLCWKTLATAQRHVFNTRLLRFLDSTSNVECVWIDSLCARVAALATTSTSIKDWTDSTRSAIWLILSNRLESCATS